MFKVYAFCTVGTPYEGVMDFYLLNSLKKFDDIRFEVLKTPSLGSWQKNTSLKPKLILDWMEKSKEGDLVILDADAEILSYPKLFDEIPAEYDMACHYLDWETWYNNNSGRKELLSGTLFLRNTEKVRDMVKVWAYLSQIGEKWEQKVLENLLETDFKEIKVYPLPLEYCYITELPGGKQPRVKCDPVIVHHQVSRLYKKAVDRQKVN